MKAKLFSLLLLLCVFANTVIAQNDNDRKFEKKKSYSKSYNLGANDKIKLNNQFGEMKLVNWDKNEIKVDVNITTSSSENDSRAQEILDRISIEDGKNGDGVYFTTKFSDEKEKKKDDNKKNGNRNESMQINYTVYLPNNKTIDAENQFGSMIVPDYKGNGNATFTSKFGTFTAGRITNAKAVNVEFGTADIAAIDGGAVSIKFSNGTINNLSGDVDANFEFCDKIKVNVDNDIKGLDLVNSYSTLYLDVNKNLSANYDITSNYGDFTNSSNFAIKQQNGNDRNYSSSYKYAGSSGSGASKMRIRNEFGKLIIGHDLKVDMKTDKNKEGKKKVKTD